MIVRVEIVRWHLYLSDREPEMMLHQQSNPVQEFAAFVKPALLPLPPCTLGFKAPRLDFTQTLRNYPIGVSACGCCKIHPL